MIFKRLPNGYGSVTELKGRRRNPYWARKRIGRKSNGQPIYKTVGYYGTRQEALNALISEGKQSFTEDTTVTVKRTFSSVFDEWFESKGNKISQKSKNQYLVSYRKLEPLHGIGIDMIKPKDIENVVSSIGNSLDILAMQVSKWVLEYAFKNEYIEKNYAQYLTPVSKHKPKIERKVFTKEELDILYQKNNVYSDMAIVGIFTGFRPTELTMLLISNVHLAERYIVGGIKTKNGIDRKVPIHKDIIVIIQKNIERSTSFHSDRLFCTNNGKAIIYNTYQKNFNETFPNHTPHDTRHTFASIAYGVIEPLALKKIMGHSTPDITFGLYTHLDVMEHLDELDKVQIR